MIVVCRVAGDPGPKGPADCVLMGAREPVVLGLGDRLPECLVQAVEDVAHGENRRRRRRSLRVSGCALDHERKAREHERDVREHHARAVRHGAVRAVVHGNGAHGTAREILDAQVPDRTVIVPMEAHGRDLRVLIASVSVAGDEQQGVFVVANDIGAQRRELWQSVALFSGMSVLVLLLAGWVGYVVTGRLLRPLVDLRGAIRNTARHWLPLPTTP